MPRLPTRLLRQARQIDSSLPLLLRACRDLRPARNELRWLREHVAALPRLQSEWQRRRALLSLCRERSTGIPLQYILGSQPFGGLEILCEPGVLIPRWVPSAHWSCTQDVKAAARPETESYTEHLANLLVRNVPSTTAKLRVLDVCSGSGCIALLLFQRLASRIRGLEVLGLDVEPRAIDLANKNAKHNAKLGHLEQGASQFLGFQRSDVLEDSVYADSALKSPWDVLISNPPYVSEREYEIETSRSARNFEPVGAIKAAPSATSNASSGSLADIAHGDRFYLPILSLAHRLDSEIVVMEVGSGAQAQRVFQAYCEHSQLAQCWEYVQLWNDNPQASSRNVDHISIRGLGGGTRDLVSHGVGSPRALVFSASKGYSWHRGASSVGRENIERPKDT